MKSLRLVIAVVLLLVGLGLLNWIGNRIPWQADLTQNQLFTLSDGSKTMLSKLSEPVTLRFYYSSSLEGIPPSFKNFAQRVVDLLRQYETNSGGKVRLEVIDPKPDTPEEEAATRAGLQGQPTPAGNFFIGLQAIQADQERVLGAFAPDREPFLEFDISQLIYQTTQVTRPKLGVITQLEMFGAAPPNQFQPQPQQGGQPWLIIDQLRLTYEVQRLTDENFPNDLAALLVLHPGELSEPMQFAIDQFLLSGKQVIVMVDPSSATQRESQGQQMMMMAQGPTSSDLPRLFARYGIEYNANEVVGDRGRATAVSARRGEPPVPYALWMSIRDFAKGTPATANLSSSLFVEAGSFRLTDGSSLSLTPLVETTDQTGTTSPAMLAFQPLDETNRSIKPDGKKRVLAGIVSGKFTTAFPDGRPAPTPPTDGSSTPPPPPPATGPVLTESAGTSTLIVFADSDFVADRFSAQALNFFGQRAIQPLNDNHAFLQNVVDLAAGSRDLIGLRSKGTGVRTFTKVEEMERAAQAKFASVIEEREKRLQDLQQQISQLQQQQGGQDLVLSPEVQKQIENFRAEEASTRRELREVRRRLREDIENLGTTLATVNGGLMPLLCALLGTWVLIARSANARRKQAAARAAAGGSN